MIVIKRSNIVRNMPLPSKEAATIDISLNAMNYLFLFIDWHGLIDRRPLALRLLCLFVWAYKWINLVAREWTTSRKKINNADKGMPIVAQTRNEKKRYNGRVCNRAGNSQRNKGTKIEIYLFKMPRINNSEDCQDMQTIPGFIKDDWATCTFDNWYWKPAKKIGSFWLICS